VSVWSVVPPWHLERWQGGESSFRIEVKEPGYAKGATLSIRTAAWENIAYTHVRYDSELVFGSRL